MSRAVDTWVGKTDDTAIPPRVKLRVWERCLGKCHRCGRKIGPADKFIYEHAIALINGGKNDEANLCLTCSWCKPIKDAEDVAIKSKSAEIRKRHLGIDRPKSSFQSRGFPPANPKRNATSPIRRKSEDSV